MGRVINFPGAFGGRRNEWTVHLDAISTRECLLAGDELPLGWRHKYQGLYRDVDDRIVGEHYMSVGIGTGGEETRPLVDFIARFDRRWWREVISEDSVDA